MSTNEPQRRPRGRDAAPSPRVHVRREAPHAVYDREQIYAVLDCALIAHLGIVEDGQPFVIPTLHARIGDELYVHGSSASRTLRIVAGEAQTCVTVTLFDGLVLARSVFANTVNYRSVVVLGNARLVDGEEEKREALRAFTEHMLPGRWDESRLPTRQELKATSILSLPLTEMSAKIRTGPPSDGASEDGQLDVWAGEIQFDTITLPPVPDPLLRPGIELPPHVRDFRGPAQTLRGRP